jgi:hypothetical protein
VGNHLGINLNANVPLSVYLWIRNAHSVTLELPHCQIKGDVYQTIYMEKNIRQITVSVDSLIFLLSDFYHVGDPIGLAVRWPIIASRNLFLVFSSSNDSTRTALVFTFS